jgi:hypothetical protein
VDDPAEEPSLAVLMRNALRRSSDAVLVLLAAGGLSGTAIIALAVPSWWRAAPLLALIAAAGAWGIGDRERSSAGARGVAFGILRGLAVVSALAAAATLVLVFFRATLGTWIS